MTCILYVDDSQTQLESVRRALLTKNLEVRTASNVGEAVAHMTDGKVDVAIIDYHMPGATGAEVLAEIRTQANPPSNVRFYIYTSDQKMQAGYRQHGFHGAFLRKGDAQALLTQLEPVLRLLELNKLSKR